MIRIRIICQRRAHYSFMLIFDVEYNSSGVPCLLAAHFEHKEKMWLFECLSLYMILGITSTQETDIASSREHLMEYI